MLTVSEAAHRLQCTEQYVRLLCKSKMIRAWKHGRAWIIDPKGLKVIAPIAKVGRPRRIGI